MQAKNKPLLFFYYAHRFKDYELLSLQTRLNLLEILALPGQQLIRVEQSLLTRVVALVQHSTVWLLRGIKTLPLFHLRLLVQSLGILVRMNISSISGSLCIDPLVLEVL